MVKIAGRVVLIPAAAPKAHERLIQYVCVSSVGWHDAGRDR